MQNKVSFLPLFIFQNDAFMNFEDYTIMNYDDALFICIIIIMLLWLTSNIIISAMACGISSHINLGIIVSIIHYCVSIHTYQPCSYRSPRTPFTNMDWINPSMDK